MALKRLPGIDLPRVIELQGITDERIRSALLAIEQNFRELLRDSDTKSTDIEETQEVAAAASTAAAAATEAVAAIEPVVVDLSAAVAALEAAVAALDSRIDATEADIAALETAVGALQSAVDALEAIVATLGDLAFEDTVSLSGPFVTGVAPLARGGTGTGTVAEGDLLVGGVGAWTKLPIGTPGQVAVVNPGGDAVEWSDNASAQPIYAHFPYFDGLGIPAGIPMPAGTVPFYLADGSITFYHAFSGRLAFLDSDGDPVLHYGLIPGGDARLTLAEMN